MDWLKRELPFEQKAKRNSKQGNIPTVHLRSLKAMMDLTNRKMHSDMTKKK
jgi:hypothetical protein